MKTTQKSWNGAGIRRRWGAAARIAGGASVASLLLGGSWVARVSAQVEQTSFDLGERLALELGDVVSMPQELAVNGQRLWIASKTTPLSVSEALDRFDAHCVAGAAGLGAGLAPLELQQAPATTTQSLGQRVLIRRAELPGRGGQLVCLAPTQPLSDMADLGQRLGALFATGEVGALGELRYVQARPRLDGGSHVISVWSAGKLNLFDALPSDTDVPGDDPERAPRPPEATRILSASVPGRAYTLHTYVSRRTAPELAAYYASEMPKQGWAAVDAERLVPATAPLSPLARAYTQGDAVSFVVVDDTGAAAGSRATVTLVQAGSPGAASALALPSRD